MPTYRIPVVWREGGFMIIEAKSLEEAEKRASEIEPLPEGLYIGDSFQLDKDNDVYGEIIEKEKKISEKEHKERHKKLHKYLDELISDFFIHTNKLFSKTPISELMQWSYKQTIDPDKK